jgi:D-lyxose ketol-isomerase
LKKTINAGQIINRSDVYFAFPPQKNQLTTDIFSKYSLFKAKKKILKDRPLLTTNCSVKNVREKIENIVKQTKKLLKKSNQLLRGKYDFEISHHYGLEKFYKFGLVMLTILNREYCKKVLILFPGQKHPEQWHKKKEETFHVLYGKINLKLNGSLKQYLPGSIITIKPGVRHEFSSNGGSVIEEISTTDMRKDSFYIDKRIMKNLNRKTQITYHWDN